MIYKLYEQKRVFSINFRVLSLQHGDSQNQRIYGLSHRPSDHVKAPLHFISLFIMFSITVF